jgi:hypothetical protein
MLEARCFQGYEYKKAFNLVQPARKYIHIHLYDFVTWVTGDRRPASVRYGVMRNILVDREP